MEKKVTIVESKKKLKNRKRSRSQGRGPRNTKRPSVKNHGTPAFEWGEKGNIDENTGKRWIKPSRYNTVMNIPRGVNQVLEEWDLMLLAKHAPGRYNTNYVCGMNVSTSYTGLINGALTMNQAYDTSTPPVLTNLGGNDYLLIMYCPVMSILYSDGASGNLPAGSKLGGMFVR